MVLNIEVDIIYTIRSKALPRFARQNTFLGYHKESSGVKTLTKINSMVVSYLQSTTEVIMTNTTNIVEQNSAIFMQNFEEAVNQGYRAENTIAGYPSVRGLLKEVFLVKDGNKDYQVSEFEPKGDVVEVIEYDAADYLLAVQKAILAGYVLDPQATVFDTLLYAKLHKQKEVTKESPKAVEKPAEVQEKTADKPKSKGRPAKKKEEVNNGTN